MSLIFVCSLFLQVILLHFVSTRFVTSRFVPLLVPPQPPSPTKSSIRTDRCPSPNFLLLCTIARSSLLSHRCGVDSCPPVSCTSDRSRLGSSSLHPCPLDSSDFLSTSVISSRAFLPGLSLRCVTNRRLFLGHVKPASLPILSHSSRVCASSITCLPETRPSRCLAFLQHFVLSVAFACYLFSTSHDLALATLFHWTSERVAGGPNVLEFLLPFALSVILTVAPVLLPTSLNVKLSLSSHTASSANATSNEPALVPSTSCHVKDCSLMS